MNFHGFYGDIENQDGLSCRVWVYFSHYEAAFFEIIILFIVSVELEYFFLGFET